MKDTSSRPYLVELRMLQRHSNLSQAQQQQLPGLQNKSLVSIIDQLGGHHTNASTAASLTLSCNNKTKWITSKNDTVENLSCAVFDPCSDCKQDLITNVPTGYTNGLATVNIYYTGFCLSAVIDCISHDNESSVTLIDQFGAHHTNATTAASLTLSCDNKTKWITQNNDMIESLSCAVLAKCNECKKLQPIVVDSLEPNEKNGRLVLDYYSNGTTGCRSVDIICSADTMEKNVTLVFNEDLEVMYARGTVSTTIPCSSEGKWARMKEEITSVSCIVTECGYLVRVLMAIVAEKSLHAVQTTLSTTTKLTTTTTKPVTSKCNQCKKLQPMALNSLESDKKNGRLILDYYSNDTTRCRFVDITCSADFMNSNVTLLVNGDVEVAYSLGSVSTTIACSSEGKWTLTNEEIISVSCIATDGAEGTVLATTTTSTTTTTRPKPNPCSNCRKDLMTNVPNGFTNGFSSMQINHTGVCISAEINCISHDNKSSVSLIDQFGLHHTNATAATSLTLTCNNKTKWITSENDTVENLSCAVLAALPISSTTSTVPSTTTVSKEVLCASTKWSEWGSWSNCTDVCGACGRQRRTRICQMPKPECSCDGFVLFF
ncbi:C6 domain protein [Dictyocaulus viviparus]|uniref:C6 domain protein n=1 Tax=Dictyocaulus viviparus TaxID=29172 RepID=A0A0D8YFP1_DICVI|nr:C6 domain protein [Dictyocaulus viviparus]